MNKHYYIASSEEEFKQKIISHYHGDKGWLYNPEFDYRCVWQCSCGHRLLTNSVDVAKIAIEFERLEKIKWAI